MLHYAVFYMGLHCLYVEVHVAIYGLTIYKVSIQMKCRPRSDCSSTNSLIKVNTSLVTSLPFTHLTRPRDNKKKIMLNSTEHEILTAMLKGKYFSCFQALKFISVSPWPF